MNVFEIRVIIPDGKNKQIVIEVVTAEYYHKDENNNIIFVDTEGKTVIEYHSYNWVSVKQTM